MRLEGWKVRRLEGWSAGVLACWSACVLAGKVIRRPRRILSSQHRLSNIACWSACVLAGKVIRRPRRILPSEHRLSNIACWRAGCRGALPAPKIGLRLILALLMLSSMLMLSSCGLKRSNPLDPTGNPNIIIPEPVVDIVVSTSALNQTPRTVSLRWTPNGSTGYYIYRALGYYASYALIGSVQVNDFIHSSANDPTVMPGDYYYKVSGYNSYAGGNLEGRQSEPLFVRVP